MRRPSLAQVLLVASVPALWLGASGCDACKKKEDPKTAAQGGATGDKRGRVEKGVLPPTNVPTAAPKDFVPITPEEVAPMVPTLTSGVQVGEPRVIAGGRRVIVSLCVDGRDQATVNPELKQKLEQLGFGNTVVKTRKRREPFDEMNWIRAEETSKNVRIAASIRRAEYPDCKKSENKTKVFLTYMKRRPVKPGAKPGENPAPQPSSVEGAAGAATAPGKPGSAVDAGFDEE